MDYVESGNLAAALQKVARLMQQARHVVALTGAGISTPSGIPDFRSKDCGLWRMFDPSEVATLSAFRYNPESFFDWLRYLATRIVQAQPNPAHYALVDLQQRGRLYALITQNIDGLHQKAGSSQVVEVHGTFHVFTCIRCYQKYDSFTQGAVDGLSFVDAYLQKGIIPRCPNCAGILKPAVILLEEQLPVKTWMRAQALCREADLMLIIGSSLEVMPVAGLPMCALENGAPLIILNKTPTYLDVRADVIIREDVAIVLPMLVEAIQNG